MNFNFLCDDNNQIMPSLTKLILFSLILLITPIVHSQQISPQSCLEYSSGFCVKCDRQTHLDQGICYTNIPGCIKHLNGTACSQCAPVISVLSGSICVAVGNEVLKRISIIKQSNPGDQFGESGFIPTTLQVVRTWPTFLTLNNNIRRGQFSHFISRSENPIYSIHYYITDRVYTYKILYYGSGGGLYLCIADVQPNFFVKLRSLTPISSTNVIDYCSDYDTNTKCLRCGPGYHLEQGKCFLNYGGCVRYMENICIQCMDYFFLVENRCVSDCISVSDARSILHYGQGRNRSNLELFYGISVSQFYTLSIRNITNTVVQTFTTTSTNSSSNPSFPIVVPSLNQNAASDGAAGANRVITTTTTTTTTTVRTNNFTSSTGGGISGIINNNGGNSDQAGARISGTNTFRDPNCVGFANNGQCAQCPPFFFKNKSNICQQVDALCLGYNQDNGECTGCYPGYTLKEGKCQVNS